MGIGATMSGALAEAGANVVIAQRRVELCEAICAEYRRAYGVDAMAHKLDVTSEPQVSEFVGTVMARYGRPASTSS